MGPKRVQAGAELALNLRPPGCHVNEDTPRGALSTGLRELRRGLQTVETLGLGLARYLLPWAPLRTGASFPSCRPLWAAAGSAATGWAAAVPLGWGLRMVVVEGGGRGGCQGSRPCHFLQILERLCSAENPVNRTAISFSRGWGQKPRRGEMAEGSDLEKDSFWSWDIWQSLWPFQLFYFRPLSTASAGLFLPSPSHTSTSTALPLLSGLALHCSGQTLCPNHPSCASDPSPTFG